MTVIDMDAKRRRKLEATDYDGRICDCGEAWYVLEGAKAAVCLDKAGRITGYHGTLACSTCGKRP